MLGLRIIIVNLGDTSPHQTESLRTINITFQRFIGTPRCNKYFPVYSPDKHEFSLTACFPIQGQIKDSWNIRVRENLYENIRVRENPYSGIF